MKLTGRHGRDLTLGEDRTRIMGVVNVTPDSFSDGGAFVDPERAIEHGLALAADGADVLDIGGESTRPNYTPISVEEQISRTRPVIEGLRKQTAVPISIDTTRAAVAIAALEAGADWINDTTALAEDPELAAVAVEHGCPIVLMHRFNPPRGTATSTLETVAESIVQDLELRVRFATDQGIDPKRIILDPGLGFGTLCTDNLLLMADVSPLRRLPYPWLFGPSRKSFIGEMTGKPASERLHGTAAAVAILAMQGVEVLRVHDVAAMVDVVKVADRLRTVAQQQQPNSQDS
ncbi:MAG: dihydropteroate synthase [Planctomycetota bacterium]|nr:dihydropteroate synthase [Planctomycetota bacterium]